MRTTKLYGLALAMTILAIVAMACAADETATPSAPAASTAPAPAPAPASALVPPPMIAPQAPQAPAAAAPAAPAQAAQAGPATTAPAPAITLARPTAVPPPVVVATSLTAIEQYVKSAGYKPEWGDPITGGILRYGASHVLIGHDPNYGHSFEGPQFLPTYNALLRFDTWVGLAGPIEGDLAETWSLSQDGLAVTFKLKEGITFQDNPNLPAEVAAKVSGDDFTCEDALASLEFAINPPQNFSDEGLTHTGPRSGLGHLKSTSCPDGALGYTFLTEFTEPLARTVTMFAGARGMPNNMDKDFLEWLYAECITCLDETTPESFLWGTGTGAFVPIEFQQDVLTKVRRNPTYFREGLPLLDGMDQFIITDGTTRFTALLTGQLDYFGEGSASLLAGQVEQVQKSFSDKIFINPALHSWGKGIQINMNREPLDDVRVRQAMHLALDRDQWIDFTQAGTQVAAQRPTNWMPPGTLWALPEDELMALPGWRRGEGKIADIAEANRLLDEALGKDVRFSISCMGQNSQIYIDGCLFFQDQMKKNVNIEVTGDFVESAVQSERGIAEQYDVHYGSKVTTNVGDPDDYYMISAVPEFESWYYKNTGAFNVESDLAVELEAMVRAQSKELDVAKRRDMVWEIERKLATEAFFQIPFPWTFIFPAWSKDVRGWTLGPFPSQIKWAQWERTWLSR
ncbi:MAG: ABC transporter substrate-binding protein [Chloroflexi bacterium]|nr:ABC transporter substrate-binding protein [Chloroflexota bacterium]